MRNRKTHTYVLTQQCYNKVINALDQRGVHPSHRVSWLAGQTIDSRCSLGKDTIRSILSKTRAVKEDSIKSLLKVLALYGESEVDWVRKRNTDKH